MQRYRNRRKGSVVRPWPRFAVYERRLALETLEQRCLLSLAQPWAAPDAERANSAAAFLPSAGTTSPAGAAMLDLPGGAAIADRLIVRFSDAVSTEIQAHLLVESWGGRIVSSLPLIHGAVVDLRQSTANLTAKAAEWSAFSSVVYAEPSYVMHVDATVPNDSRFGELWAMNNTGQTGGTVDADIDAPEAWSLTAGSSTVIVADIDTGADYNHVDLAANIWTNPGEVAGDWIDNDGNGYVDDVHGIDTYNHDSDPMDDHGHGTHTAGTIGAVGNNSIGVAGVNWNVKIMPLKFLDQSGWGSTDGAVECLQYLTMMKTQHGINVVASNNSWGGNGYSQALRDAIAASNAAGVLFVAAAGNDGANNDALPHYPSGYDLPGIVAVAASDPSDQKASFSNYGATSVDLAAPGVNILSTVPGSGYAYSSGTSMAAPHVTGVAGLAMAFSPGATPAEIKAAILAGVDPVPLLTGLTLTGGRLNAYNTLLNLSLMVRSSTPADGAVLNTAPHDFVVNFSHPYNPASVNAGDLTVNSLVPNAVVQTDADTLTFHFNTSPVSVGGLQTMTIAAGALTRLNDNNPIRAWNATFRYDTVPMAVTSTDPPDETLVSLPMTSLRVHLNEAVDPASIGVQDVTLNQGAVTKATLVAADTVEYTLSGIVEEGTLTVRIDAGALTDQYGNPVLAYAGNFVLDYTTAAFPTPLKDKQPAGSLVYEGARSGRLSSGVDVDSFTISLDAGQILTAIVDPGSTLQPRISLAGPDSLHAGPVAAPGAGKDAVLANVVVSQAGVYTLTIDGASGTAGAYNVRLLLNAAAEAEEHDGPANDAPENAQDLTASFLDLGGGVERGAVVGTAQTGGDWYRFTLAAGQTATLVMSGDATANLDLYSGSLLLARGVGAENVTRTIENFVASTAGLYSVRVTGAGEYSLVVVRGGDFDTEPNASAATAQDITVAKGALGRVRGDSGAEILGADAYRWDDGTHENSIGLTDGGDVLWLNSFDVQPGKELITSVSLAWGAVRSGIPSSVVVYEDPNDDGDPSDALLLTKVDATVANPDTNTFTTVAVPPTFVSGKFFVAALLRNQQSGEFPMSLDQTASQHHSWLVGHNTAGDLDVDDLTSNDLPPAMADDYFPGNWLLRADGQSVIDNDYYQMRVLAGDQLVISTGTPSGDPQSPFEFVNTLDPAVQLYDPGGNWLAGDDNSGPDGKNALLRYTATIAGTYTVRMLGSGDSKGDYVLYVSGAHGADPAPQVATADPDVGQVVLTFPTTYMLHFSEAMLATSFQAGDLLIGGVPATSVTQIDGDTFTFTIPAAANTGDGVYAVILAAGAVTDLQNVGNTVFHGAFTLDTAAPRILSTRWNGQTLNADRAVPAGWLTFQAVFNEALLPNAIDAADVSLVNLVSGQTYPTAAVSYDVSARTLTAAFAGLADGAYTLALASGDNALEDLVGNDLDGEPGAASLDGTPSGNSVAGGNYYVNFFVDADTTAVLTPLTIQQPVAALVYQGDAAGLIHSKTDIDRFTIQLDHPQSVTIAVEPLSGWQPVVELVGPGSVSLGTASALAAGQGVVLQTATTSGAGTYTIVVHAAGDMSGAYAVRIVLNAALEAESHGGPANNDRSSAQDIDAAFVRLSGDMRRAAVVGAGQTAPTDQADFYRLTLNAGDVLAAGFVGSAPGGLHLAVESAAGETVAEGTPGNSLDEVIADFAAPAAGVYYIRVDVLTASDYTLVLVRNGHFDTDANKSLATAQDIDHARCVLGSIPSLADAAPIVADGFETGSLGSAWSTYSSTANGRVQITGAYGVGAGSHALTMDTTVSGAYNLNEAVWTVDLSNVQRPTLTFSYASFGDEDDAFNGDFYDHYSADGIAISADGALWHPIWNAGSGAWQSISLDLAALAAAEGVPLDANFRIKFQQYDDFSLPNDGRAWDDIRIDNADDYFQFSATAGSYIRLATATPGGGSGEPSNLLDPRIELYDPSGTPLRQDDNGAGDGRNAELALVALSTGVYRVRVSAAGGTSGAYILNASGVVVLPSGTNTKVQEGGRTDTYLVALASPPQADVVINLHSDGQVVAFDDSQPANSVLTFTPANWSVPRTVRVTAVDDAVIEGPHSASITHTISSADPRYNGLAVRSVAVLVGDNDGVAPVVRDDVYETRLGVPLSAPAGGVLANDVDADNDTLSAVLDIAPHDGTLALLSDGSFVYTPNPGFAGTDLFTYRARDSRGISSALSATVWIHVQPPQIVKDINTSLAPSNPTSFVECDGAVFFVATDQVHGTELWATDGTPGGTRLVKDIYTGANSSSPGKLTGVNGFLYFSALNAADGYELWRSDGTEAGTVLVKDIYAGGNSASPNYLVNVNGTLFFAASTSTGGTELWRSDGTEAGTYQVADIWPGPSSSNPNRLTDVDGTLFFIALDATNGAELWKSDGTASGTTLVKDVWPGASSPALANFCAVGRELYFTANDGSNGSELWKSDGTDTGTTLVKDIVAGGGSASPGNLTNVDGTLFFSAFTSAVGMELWRSDGTAAGTVLVKDISPGVASSSPGSLVNLNGTLFFSANDGIAGTELWKSDGDDAGTVLVKDIYAGAAASAPTSLTVVEDALYFAAYDPAHGSEWWRSDGSAAGTVLVQDIQPGTGGSSPSNLAAAGGSAYFSSDNGATGAEPWRSDDVFGTFSLGDLNPGTLGSSTSSLKAIGVNLFFNASDSASGSELWRSDGTAAGTARVADIYSGSYSSSPSSITDMGGIAFFTAYAPGVGTELWRSDGAEAGTALVKDIFPGSSSSYPANLLNVNGRLFFTASNGAQGAELWRSDGTAAGTVLVKDICPGTSGASISNLTAVGSILFFTANDGASGYELWRSDGTSDGTVLVKDIYSGSGSSSPAYLRYVNGVLYFRATDPSNGAELWRSDGTPDGTVLVKDIYLGTGGSNPSNLNALGGILVFACNDGADGYELWRSDGSAEGTVLVKDVSPGAASSSPAYLVSAIDVLFFVANDGTHGAELWKSDGTTGGTALVADIRVGAFSASVFSMVATEKGVALVADDGIHGPEIWTSDGSPQGTRMLADLYRGAGEALPANLVAIGSTLYFTADDGVSGRELWSVSLNPPPQAHDDPYTTAEDRALTVNANDGVLSNDFDPGGKPLKALLVSPASHGALTLNLDGSFAYAPARDYYGVDTFSYVAFNDETYSETATVTITITVADDAPSELLFAGAAVKENCPAGTLVGAFQSVDPDDTTGFRYTLVEGPGSDQNGWFQIDGNQLRTAAELDYETHAAYSIRVRTTDPSGLWLEQTFAVQVEDVRDFQSPGLYDPVQSLFYLRNSNSQGPAERAFGFGAPNAGWKPIAGDWNGDGIDTIGLYDPASSWFYLRNSNNAGSADYAFGFGDPAQRDQYLIVMGDWNGDGVQTVGLYHKASSTWFLRNSSTPGYADITFGFGAPGAGWTPLVGDWNGDGIDTAGFYDATNAIYYLRNTNDMGMADYAFGYGVPGSQWLPVMGDWDGNTTDTIGFFDAATGQWYLRNSNDQGFADLSFGYGAAGAGWLPIVGNWIGEALSLQADAPAAATADPTPLTTSELASIVDAVLARWATLGLPSEAAPRLTDMRCEVADLPGTLLGLADNRTIYLDRDAAGHGWFVDPTPLADEEFSAAGQRGILAAVDARVAERMDLFSAVAHEMGHLAGLDDLDATIPDLMSGMLHAGQRRIFDDQKRGFRAG